jgi:cell wall assembly regulator SMI1
MIMSVPCIPEFVDLRGERYGIDAAPGNQKKKQSTVEHKQ